MSESRTPSRVTPWYPPEIEPVRVGVYERDNSQHAMAGRFSYWNGQVWCGWGGTVSIAHWNGKRNHVSSAQHLPWRGLARKS